MCFCIFFWISPENCGLKCDQFKCTMCCPCCVHLAGCCTSCVGSSLSWRDGGAGIFGACGPPPAIFYLCFNFTILCYVVCSILSNLCVDDICKISCYILLLYSLLLYLLALFLLLPLLLYMSIYEALCLHLNLMTKDTNHFFLESTL